MAAGVSSHDIAYRPALSAPFVPFDLDISRNVSPGGSGRRSGVSERWAGRPMVAAMITTDPDAGWLASPG